MKNIGKNCASAGFWLLFKYFLKCMDGNHNTCFVD